MQIRAQCAMFLLLSLSAHNCHRVVREDPYCETPTLPRNTFHIVIAGYAAKTCFAHYLWDLGLSNADVFIYRRTALGEPVKSWTGPCGMRAQEVLLAPNAGRDGAAFYDYVLQVYKQPPAAVMFVHAHGGIAYHTSCEAMFSRAHMYYQSLARVNYTGLSKHMMTLTAFGEEFGAGRYTVAYEDAPFDAIEGAEADQCKDILAKWGISINKEEHFFSCCATFIVPGERLVMYPQGFYQDLKSLVMDPKLDVQNTGRVCFEYIIYALFNEPLLTDEMQDWYTQSTELGTDVADRSGQCKDANRQTSC